MPSIYKNQPLPLLISLVCHQLCSFVFKPTSKLNNIVSLSVLYTNVKSLIDEQHIFLCWTQNIKLLFLHTIKPLEPISNGSFSQIFRWCHIITSQSIDRITNCYAERAIKELPHATEEHVHGRRSRQKLPAPLKRTQNSSTNKLIHLFQTNLLCNDTTGCATRIVVQMG